MPELSQDEEKAYNELKAMGAFSEGGVDISKKKSRPPSWSDVTSDARWNESAPEKKKQILDKWQRSVAGYAQDSGAGTDFDIGKHLKFVNEKENEINQDATFQKAIAPGGTLAKASEAIPFHGFGEKLEEGDVTGKGLLGDNIAGQAAGKVIGAVNAGGTLFNPIVSGLEKVSRLGHAGAQAVQGKNDIATGILRDNKDTTPWLKFAPTESTAQNFINDLLKQGVSDPANTAAMIYGLKQLPGSVKPTAAWLESKLEKLKVPEAGAQEPIASQPPEAPPETVTPEKQGLLSKVSDELESRFKAREANIQEKEAKVSNRNTMADEAAAQAREAMTSYKASNPMGTVDPTLPQTLSRAVKNADLNKVNPQHIKFLLSTTSEERPIIKRMSDAAKEFSENNYNEAHDPALIVGEDIRTKVDNLDKIRKAKGEELGEITKNISKEQINPMVETVSPKDAALSRMRQIPELKGLKLNEEGKLDFADTVLNTIEDVGEQKKLQANFDSLEGKTPHQLWLLRQGLRKNLESAKRAGSYLTDTYDQGVNAIRGGLMDYLDTTNPEFKAKSTEYAKIAEPLENLESFIGDDIKGAPENLLKERAGMLARRLTSNTKSGAELKNLLNQVEEQLKGNGVEVGTSTTRLQNVYNALSQYYPEIVKGTSLEGIANRSVNLGAGKINAAAEGLKYLGEKVGADFSKSDVARRQALRDLIDSLEKVPSVKKGAPVLTPEEQQFLFKRPPPPPPSSPSVPKTQYRENPVSTGPSLETLTPEQVKALKDMELKRQIEQAQYQP